MYFPDSARSARLPWQTLDAAYQAFNFATGTLHSAFELAGAQRRVELVSFWARVGDDTLISYVETLERCTGERAAGSRFFLTFDEGEAIPVLPIVAELCAAARCLLAQDEAAPSGVDAAVSQAAAWARRAGVSDVVTASVAAGMAFRDAVEVAAGEADIVERQGPDDLAAHSG